MIDIGKALKEHRENEGLSQAELARKTGIKQQNISRWEKNENFPNIIDCITLADFYGISIDYLIGYENDDGSKNEIFSRIHRPAPKHIYEPAPQNINEMLHAKRKTNNNTPHNDGDKK